MCERVGADGVMREGCDEIATYGGIFKFGIMSNDVIIKDCGGEFYEFVRNSKGTLIKKCCASCKYKLPYDAEGPRRSCTRNPNKSKIVKKSYCCSHWWISEEADRIKTLTSRPDLVEQQQPNNI